MDSSSAVGCQGARGSQTAATGWRSRGARETPALPALSNGLRIFKIHNEEAWTRVSHRLLVRGRAILFVARRLRAAWRQHSPGGAAFGPVRHNCHTSRANPVPNHRRRAPLGWLAGRKWVCVRVLGSIHKRALGFLQVARRDELTAAAPGASRRHSRTAINYRRSRRRRLRNAAT